MFWLCNRRAYNYSPFNHVKFLCCNIITQLRVNNDIPVRGYSNGQDMEVSIVFLLGHKIFEKTLFGDILKIILYYGGFFQVTIRILSAEFP